MKNFILEQFFDIHLILPFSKDEETLNINEMHVLVYIKN